MTPEARNAFNRVKDLLANASQLVIMNETDPLILYTDASTVSIDAGAKWSGKPHHFHFTYLVGSSDAMGELELYAFVYCVKQLTPYLMGKLFTVKTDHKTSSISRIRQFQSWPVGECFLGVQIPRPAYPYSLLRIMFHMSKTQVPA